MFSHLVNRELSLAWKHVDEEAPACHSVCFAVSRTDVCMKSAWRWAPCLWACEGTLAGDWGLGVWGAGSQATSWSPCLGHPFSLSVHVMVVLLLPSWIWQRWWNVMFMIALQKMVPSVLLKATLSLAGFVKASDRPGELGPQCSQTAKSWDISLTASRGWILPIDVLPILNVVFASGASWLTFLIISTAGMTSTLQLPLSTANGRPASGILLTDRPSLVLGASSRHLTSSSPPAWLQSSRTSEGEYGKNHEIPQRSLLPIPALPLFQFYNPCIFFKRRKKISIFFNVLWRDLELNSTSW